MGLHDSVAGQSGADKESGVPVGHAVDRQSRIVIPDTFHLHITLEGMPQTASAVPQSPAKPAKSKLVGFVEDYSSVFKALIPVLSLIVGFWTGSAYNDNLRKHLDEFAPARGNSNIDAMKSATAGEEGLPAVGALLASDDEKVRKQGESIARQMYLEKTVKPPGKVVDEMSKNYSIPDRRLGVLDWFKEMNGVLPPEEVKPFLDVLRDGFKTNRCGFQDPTVAKAAAEFLKAWSLPASQDLVLKMTVNCPKEAGWLGVRETTLNTLPELASQVPADQRKSIRTALQELRSQREEHPNFVAKIDGAIDAIDQIE
jgi:hypothetical protein